MITMERLNVVRQVATEEQAERLLAKGFTRKDGAAEEATAATVTEADIARMGEAMYERLQERLRAEVATLEKGKSSKAGKAGVEGGAGAGSTHSGGGSE